MDIAFLTSAFLRNMKESTSITTISLAKEFIRNKQNVVVITERKKDYPEYEKINNVSIYRFFNGDITGHAKTLDRIQKKIDIKFNIIHGFSASPLLVLRTIMAKKYAKNAKTVHTLKSYPKRFSFGINLLDKVDAITVPTKIMKEKLINKGISSNKVRVVHSFINTKKFIHLNKEKLKARYGCKNKKILFYYGSLYKKKGVKYLIKAMPQIIKQNQDALLILAPRHKVPADYTELINKLNLNNHIRIMTEDINVVEYVNLADIVVLPYIDLIGTEGNPSCLLESIACKTPVVTTDQPELREIVTPNKDVLMAIPKNETNLAENINKLLKNKKLQKTLSENAYKKIKNFDIEVISRQFINLYKTLMKE